MSELTGTPGNSCSLVRAPTSSNGIDRAKTSKKYFRGDLLRDAIIFVSSFLDILVSTSERKLVAAVHSELE